MAVPMTAQAARSRWALARAWAMGLALYLVAMKFATGQQAMWLADGSWTLASALACGWCFHAARRVEPLARRAWQLLGCGCLSWLTGQLHWDYARLVQGIELPFPSRAHAFYIGFAVFMLLGVRQLPRLRQPSGAGQRQVGNIAAVTACLAVILILGMVGPALRTDLAPLYLWGGLLHTVVVTAAFLLSLHALWSFQWERGWNAMLMLVMANGLYVLSNIIYAHALLTDSYVSTALVNVGWLAMFGLVACAAHEQVWTARHPPVRGDIRGDWLLPLAPAVLVVVMAIVAVSSAATLSPEVVSWSVAMFVLLSLLLGAREVWMQRDQRTLTAGLHELSARLPEPVPQPSEAGLQAAMARLQRAVVHGYHDAGALAGIADGFPGKPRVLRTGDAPTQRLAQGMQHYLDRHAARYLRRYRRGQLDMPALVDDLLRYYSRCEGAAPGLVRLDLPRLVEQTWRELRSDVGHCRMQLQCERDPFLLHSRAGELPMVLVLRALLHNAGKFTRRATAPQVTVRCLRECGQVVLIVDDNGIGFDMRHARRLFQPFQCLHDLPGCAGAGLGLVLVSRAALWMAGTVCASSVPHAGAHFEIRLPDFATPEDRRTHWPPLPSTS